MRYIRSHTALRGIAALLVCVYHYVMFVCGADWMAGASRLLANGYAAVDLFFVLSGYILTARYGHVFAAGIERGAWRDFINRRFARLYPLHLATLAMALPFALFRKNADLPAQEVIGDLALNLLMVQSWGFRPEATFNFPSWSISVEWGAYLVFPLLAALFLKGPRGRLALLGLVILGYAWIASMGRGLEVETEHRLIRGLLGFALGMLAFAWRDLGRIAHPGGLALAQVVAAGGAILTLSQPAPVGVEFMPFAAALTVLLHEDRGPLGRAMQGRGAVWLGEASYSIYMLHMPVFWIVKEILMRAGLFDRAAIAEAPLAVGGGLVLLCLAVLLPLAHLSHAWFETPARRGLSTLLAASPERRRAARARLQGAGTGAPQP